MSIMENTSGAYDLSINVDEQSQSYNNQTETISTLSQNEVPQHNNKNLLNSEIKIELCDSGLWELFNNVVNEMIVTRDGRRMFPVLKVSVFGLQPNAMYKIALDFLPADTHRWKYVNGEWIRGTRVDLPSSTRSYFHPDSPNYGAFWMQSGVSFARAKITNREDHSHDKIYLYSMHKYTPRVTIYKVSNTQEEDQNISSASFRITEFIAVTAYQNESVTLLKVKFNPFAKAFLDSCTDSSDGKYNENIRKMNVPKSSSFFNQNNMYNGTVAANMNKYNNSIAWSPWNNSPFCASNMNYQQQNCFPQYGFNYDYYNSRGYNNSTNSPYDLVYNNYQAACTPVNYPYNGYRYSTLANRSIYTNITASKPNSNNNKSFSYTGFSSAIPNKSDDYSKVNDSDYRDCTTMLDTNIYEKSKSKLNFLADIAAKFKNEEDTRNNLFCTLNHKRMTVNGNSKTP